jgi:hypothetical protein
VVFQTRWAMSYLRGPLTKAQIEALTPAVTASAPAPPASPASPAPRASSSRPALPPDAEEVFAAGAVSRPLAPSLLGVADAHFVDRKTKVDIWREVALAAPLEDDAGATVWDDAAALDPLPEFAAEPPAGATFAEMPAAALNAKSYATWNKALASQVYRSATLTLFACPALKLTSEPGETEAAFGIRVRQARHETRDGEVQKLRKKYASKIQTLQDRLRRAEERVAREQSQFQTQTMQTAISVGATVLGALLGRKAVSMGTVGRATTAARGAGRAARERGDVARARGEVEVLRGQLADIESEVQRAMDAAAAKVDGATEIVTSEIRPRKSDIAVRRVGILWR